MQSSTSFIRRCCKQAAARHGMSSICIRLLVMSAAATLLLQALAGMGLPMSNWYGGAAAFVCVPSLNSNTPFSDGRDCARAVPSDGKPSALPPFPAALWHLLIDVSMYDAAYERTLQPGRRLSPMPPPVFGGSSGGRRLCTSAGAARPASCQGVRRDQP